LAAGFRVVTVTNPQQQRLRPNKVTVTERDGKTYYVYVDPALNQIYIGDQSQYQRYRQLKKELEAPQQSTPGHSVNATDFMAARWKLVSDAGAHLFLLLSVTLTQAIVKRSVSEQESDHVFGPFISSAATA